MAATPDMNTPVRVKVKGIPIGSGSSTKTYGELVKIAMLYPNSRMELLTTDSEDDLNYIKSNLNQIVDSVKRFSNFTPSRRMKMKAIIKMAVDTETITRAEGLRQLKELKAMTDEMLDELYSQPAKILAVV